MDRDIHVAQYQQNTRERLRISEAVLQLPCTPLWRTQPQLHRFFFATVKKSKYNGAPSDSNKAEWSSF